jgi:ketosteroid isomerase-like protein
VSRENVEIVRRAIESVNGGQIAEECFDAQVEYNTIPEGPVGGTYHGVVGVQQGLRSLQEAWDEIKVEARSFIEAGDALVASVRYTVLGRTSGITLDGEEPWAFWLRNGLIYRLDQYATKSQALKAVGLES